MEKLYEEYGKLMVQQEILSQKINQVKVEINNQLNNPKDEEDA